MAEVLYINSPTLVNMADRVRDLDNIEDKLSTEEMIDRIRREKGYVDQALYVLSEKGVNVPEGANAQKLGELINELGGSVANGFPEFDYTGVYELVNDGFSTKGIQNWQIKFLTSGILTFTELGSGAAGVDVFCVGGGGGGNYSGGGGGYTTNAIATCEKNKAYEIVVGDGGNGTDGGTTSAFNVYAEGGKYGADSGGAGGSGGGGSGYTHGGNGGSDGGDGGAGYDDRDGQWVVSLGGIGQGTTTRAFGEPDGELYAGGGAARSIAGDGSDGAGGEGGGGKIGQETEANTGGGGSAHHAGGSGIVIIRNIRNLITYNGLLNLTAVESVDKLPTNSPDNAIAIISSTEINNIYISAVEPIESEIGDIWVRLGGDNKITVQTKEETIEFGVKTIYQYNGTEWASVDAYIYANGIPTLMLQKFYILESGVRHVPMTLNNCVQSGGYLYLAAGDDEKTYCLTTDAIDITNKTTLYVKGYNVDHAYTAEATAHVYGTWLGNSMASSEFTDDEIVHAIDISNLEGSYYLGVYGSGYGYNSNTYTVKAYVSDIWLE